MAESVGSSGYFDLSKIGDFVLGEKIDKECGTINFEGNRDKLTDGSPRFECTL